MDSVNKLKERYTKYNLAFFLILLVGIILRLTYFYYNKELYFKEDALCRVNISSNLPYLFDKGRVPGGFVWLPFHFLVMGVFEHILSFSSLLSGQIISLICGCLSLILIYKVSYLIFKNKNYALLIMSLMTFNAYHIGFSLFPLSTILFSCLSLLSIYYYLKYTADKSKVSFTMLLLFSSLASLTRFEGWLFSFFYTISLFYLLRNKGKSEFLPLLFLIIPFSYTLITYKLTGVLKLGPPDFGVVGPEYYTSSDGQLWTPKRIFIEIFSFYPNWLKAIGMTSIIYAFYCRVRLDYLFLLLIIFAAPLYKLWDHSLMPEERYLIPPLVVALPYSMYIFKKVNLSNKFLILGISAVISLSLFSYKAAHSRFSTDAPVYRTGFIKTAQWIRENRLKNEKVFMSMKKPQWNCNWQMYSQCFSDHCYVHETYYNVENYLKNYSENLGNYKDHLLNENVKYLMFYKGGPLEKMTMDLKRQNYFVKRKISLKEKFRLDGYSIFKINH